MYIPGNETGKTLFSIGQTVIYGVHGRCQVKDIEKKQLNGEEIAFYKLEVSKYSSTKKTDSFILVPIDSAQQKGLRVPIENHECEEVFEILSSEAAFLKSAKNWHETLSLMKNLVETEGAQGLAKSIHFLHNLKKQKQNIPCDVIKFENHLSKQLLKELSDTLKEPLKAMEEKFYKVLKSKPLSQA